jgi:5-methyltetrahydrofolate--homocysteine methyltransferase
VVRINSNFVDDFCRPIYKGALFYCRDAFDGVIAMGRIEQFVNGITDKLDDRLQVI